MKLNILQKKYPRFVYEKYSFNNSGKNLRISFYFKIEPDISFRPEVVIKNCPQINLAKIDNLVFNLGLIEMISYWKATCSKVIEIRAGYLSKEQILWWQNLIQKGLGQFFYENRIPFQKPKFLVRKGFTKPVFKDRGKGVLVPIGGGKDSAVALELLKRTKEKINCICLNPTTAAERIMKTGECRDSIIGTRKIDERLLDLNGKGFLNGHTPISAYFAFFCTLAAALFSRKYIALANERSANEGNVKYMGKTINHQWSKSFEFENKFRSYSKKYLAKNIEYFSLLRPLYEIQITRLFSKYPKYLPVFLSCNEAYKTASGTKKPTKKWCGKCSKCLFAFIVLYPFLKEKELLKIFKKNLFGDKNLLPIMQELIGESGTKPFECVGTQKESLVAFYLSWKKNKSKPFLLEYFERKILPKHKNLDKVSRELLASWNKENYLPKHFLKLVR